MVRTMIKKTEYVPCTRLGSEYYKLMFGRKDVVPDVSAKNDNGERMPTGEKESTDYCEVTMEIVRYKPSADYIAKMMMSAGEVDMNEAAIILSNFTLDVLPVLKKIQIHNISLYDTSEAVNSFVLGGKEMWLSKDTRVGLRNSIGIEREAGRTETTLWYGGVSYVVPIDMALELLSQLELYALTCYNVTESHKAAIMAMDNVEDVTAYDYKTGYPDRMVVSL